MAKKHRKLFPTETTTNQTQDCSGFCDPACPYNCYSYPDYYFSPPPPISSNDHSNNINHISSYLIILVSLFALIFVAVGFYVIKLKCYGDWCGWRVNGSVPSQSNNSEDEFLNESQVDHHPVWLITTIGLQQSIINSISVSKYRKDEGLIEGTECSVCLNEFQEGETLRLLPKCNHAFHIPCIDTWLRSHTNCPLCRAGIVSNNIVSDAAESNLDSVDQENNSNSGRNQESRIENSQNNDEGMLLLANNIVTGVALENSAAIGEASDEALEFTTDESCFKERVNVNNDQTEDHRVQNDEIQTDITRIVSHVANSSSSEDERQLQIDKVSKEDGDESKTSEITMRRSSIEECLHISPVSMKRSFSCSGRILYARGYMSLNSTHPY